MHDSFYGAVVSSLMNGCLQFLTRILRDDWQIDSYEIEDNILLELCFSFSFSEHTLLLHKR